MSQSQMSGTPDEVWMWQALKVWIERRKDHPYYQDVKGTVIESVARRMQALERMAKEGEAT